MKSVSERRSRPALCYANFGLSVQAAPPGSYVAPSSADMALEFEEKSNLPTLSYGRQSVS